VTKAVEKILEDAAEGGRVGPESLPILKLALKYAPEPSFRRKVAETLAGMGAPAAEALPDLVDAFERTGFTRDYNLIRPMVVLGKESTDVADALIRALEDRDSTVRLLAAFNVGQMGEPAMRALEMLEDVAERDPEPKVRDTALKTLNKLRARLEPVGVVPVDEETAEESA
jgi:HEAT repeat protein